MKMLCKQHKLNYLVFALVLVGLLFSVPAYSAQKAKVRIGWTPWSGAEAVTTLAKQILEEKMDCEVELTMTAIGLQYQGLAKESLDVMLMSWLPETHKNYWDKFHADVVNLGAIYTRAHLGWVVPDYIPKTQLKSIEDLSKPEVAEKLKKTITGIDPGSGIMQASEKAMEAYGLKDMGYYLVSASGAGMTASLSKAIRNKEWIVVTGWKPHWKFAKWDLRFLDDPKSIFSRRERIHKLARENFYQETPVEVFNFFTRLYLPLEHIQKIMLDASDMSYEEAIDKYIKEHPKRVNYWVTGQFE